MTVTAAQLATIAKFTYGASGEYPALSSTGAVALVRRGDGGDAGGNSSAFRKHTYTVNSYVEGSNLADLQTKVAALTANLAKADQDFTLYRQTQIIVQLLTAGCHHGPLANLTLTDADTAGTRQSFSVTVEAIVPVSLTAGLISHTYSDGSTTDEDEVTQTTRTGRVTTQAGTSAKAWIEANLPAPGSGYIRKVQIDKNDTDTEATYTVTDSESPYRNASPGIVKTHTYTDKTVTEDGITKQTSRTGQVETETGTDAGTWINGNLPTLESGYSRTFEVTVDDTRLVGSYTVTDTKVSGETSFPPGLDEARLEYRTSYDSQRGKVMTVTGKFVGDSAYAEYGAVRAMLPEEHIIREEISQETYGDGAVSFTITVLYTRNDDDLISYTETVRMSGGGYSKRVVTQPDREPFIYNDVQLPVIITISGRAVARGKYAAPPALYPGLEDYIDGLPSIDLNQADEHAAVTSWNHRYVMPSDPGYVLPRAASIPFTSYIEGGG